MNQTTFWWFCILSLKVALYWNENLHSLWNPALMQRHLWKSITPSRTNFHRTPSIVFPWKSLRPSIANLSTTMMALISLVLCGCAPWRAGRVRCQLPPATSSQLWVCPFWAISLPEAVSVGWMKMGLWQWNIFQSRSLLCYHLIFFFNASVVVDLLKTIGEFLNVAYRNIT